MRLLHPRPDFLEPNFDADRDRLNRLGYVTSGQEIPQAQPGYFKPHTLLPAPALLQKPPVKSRVGVGLSP